MDIVKRMRITVSGRVQGVFFRAATREQARALGVAGWVRNRSDGSVEILAEGSELALQALLQWCGKGPPRARVDRVDMAEEAISGEFREFEVRRDG